MNTTLKADDTIVGRIDEETYEVIAVTDRTAFLKGAGREFTAGLSTIWNSYRPNEGNAR